MITLETECENLLFVGFFGMNENGDWPECGEYITEDVEEDSLVVDEYGTRPCYEVECPKCGCSLGWPHNWSVLKVSTTKDESPLIA